MYLQIALFFNEMKYIFNQYKSIFLISLRKKVLR